MRSGDEIEQRTVWKDEQCVHWLDARLDHIENIQIGLLAMDRSYSGCLYGLMEALLDADHEARARGNQHDYGSSFSKRRCFSRK